MNTVETITLLLFASIFLVGIAQKLKLPGEIVLVIGGALVAFIPGHPDIHLEPEFVFFFFLPPILYSAALFTSWREFTQNLRPISFLAVGLVLFTTCGVAIAAHALIPGLSWPAGFLLGSIVSPPDAIAATAITKQISVPRRLVVIMEGESLVNDATALVAYRFALAAMMTGGFSWSSACVQLLVVSVGGAAIGFASAYAILEMRRRVSSVMIENLLALLTPFAAYLIAERLHVSGVLSVVFAGLYVARKIPTSVSAETRLRAVMLWEFFTFLLNAIVFIVIGLQLGPVLSRLKHFSWGDLALYASVLCAVVIVVRFVWVFPATYLPRYLAARIRGKDLYTLPYPSWRPVTVLAWAGMRGIVSLAAVMALPMELPNGDPFPHRDLLVFLTYAVIFATLVIPGLTLGTLIKRLGISDGGESRKEELEARIATAQAALLELEGMEAKNELKKSSLEHLRTEYDLRLQVLAAALGGEGCLPEYTDEEQLRLSRLRLLTIERNRILELRRHNEVDDEVLLRLQAELDIDELRLQGQKAQREEFQAC